MNKWISFVKDYAKSNNLKYRDALKSSACKTAYQESKNK